MEKTIIKRYNFRIYPTIAQEAQIVKTLGCCRFVYNHFLAKRIDRYKENGTTYEYREMSRDLTLLKKQDGYHWLAEADAAALHASVKALDNAYSLFSEGLSRTA